MLDFILAFSWIGIFSSLIIAAALDDFGNTKGCFEKLVKHLIFQLYVLSTIVLTVIYFWALPLPRTAENIMTEYSCAETPNVRPKEKLKVEVLSCVKRRFSESDSCRFVKYIYLEFPENIGNNTEFKVVPINQ